MKRSLFILLAVLVGIIASSCKKETFITSPNASLSLSNDTLYFDTVFTTTGSVTQFFKIYNNNNQKLLLSTVKLMGGSKSFFKFNLDGTAGTVFNNVEIAANDSMYGFVTVSINANDSLAPFLRQDSIQISYNGNTQYLQLAAYGQNAHFLKNFTIANDTTWNKTLPIVILGGLTINKGVTLNILKGTNIYLHSDAAIQVDGTLNAQGTADSASAITFQCDRLDYPYNLYPGSWPGIYFGASSKDNVMQYCKINNAYEGVIVDSLATDGNPKLTLNQCLFNNIYDVAIGGSNTTINLTSCLVSNCGTNISLVGGTYNINQSTIASYANVYVDHKHPVLTLSNTNSLGISSPLSCNIQNSILYGSSGTVNNEIALINGGGAGFSVNFYNVLYRETNADSLSQATLNSGCIPYTTAMEATTPIFDSINTGTPYFNFHLKPSSPSIGTGTISGPLYKPFTMNLDGQAFLNPPNIGCY